MSRGTANAIGIEDGNTKLANRLRGKTNSAFDAAKKSQRRRFPQALIIDRGIPASGSQALDDLAQRRDGPSFGGPDLRGQVAALNQEFPARVRQPDYFAGRERFTQR